MAFSMASIAQFFGLNGEEDEQQAYQPVSKPKPSPAAGARVQPQGQTRYRQEQPRAVAASKMQGQTQKTAAASGTAFRQKQEEKVVAINRQEPRRQASRPAAEHKSRPESKTAKAGAQDQLITIMQPRVYSEAMTIADRVIKGEAVLVNFQLLEETQARRIVDFLTGTVYAEAGDIQRVGDEIFLCTPANMKVDRSAAQNLVDAQQLYEM